MAHLPRPSGLRATAVAAAHTEWLLLLVLVTALALALFTTVTFVVVDSAYLLSAKLIGSEAPLRNLLEVLSFLSQGVLVGVALFALIFAKKQAQEAENARLASVYSQLEERWSSATMLKARVMFRELVSEFQIYRGSHPSPSMEIAEYFDQKLTDLARHSYGEYLTFMAMIDYLEFIGMLEENRYVAITDIEAIMGELCVYARDVLAVHIEEIRKRNRSQTAKSGYSNVPDAYRSFSNLAEKFAVRFRAPPAI